MTERQQAIRDAFDAFWIAVKAAVAAGQRRDAAANATLAAKQQERAADREWNLAEETRRQAQAVIEALAAQEAEDG